MLPLAALALSAPAAAAPDWAALLRADVAFYHATQMANHPGPVNPDDPGFAARLATARDKALARAATVNSAGGYAFALREMVASFNDGHMYLGFGDKLPLPSRWPGFIAAWHDDALLVRASSPGGPPIGARLVDCDGQNTAALGAARVGHWRGNWGLAAQREALGWRVFYDQGNPFIAPLRECRFRLGKQVRSYNLQWRDAPADFVGQVQRVNSGSLPPIGLRQLPGLGWISASTFTSEAGSDGFKALQKLVAGVQRDAPALQSTPRLVFDLRGNHGGSSDWGVQLANAIWGAGAVARARNALDPGVRVTWRASAENAGMIKDFCASQTAPGVQASADTLGWCASISTRIAAALAAGEPLFTEPETPPLPVPPGAPARTRPTFVLVDSACGSACLDAVDVFTALGAVVVGRTTSADSNYMEVRGVALPSGMGEFSVPMKVYRGRSRGSGVAVAPKYRFTGDMADEAGLERWIRQLPG